MRMPKLNLFVSVVCVGIPFLGCGDGSLEPSKSVVTVAAGGNARKTKRMPLTGAKGPSLISGVSSAGGLAKTSFVEKPTSLSTSAKSEFYRNLEVARRTNLKILEVCSSVKDEKSFTNTLLEMESWNKMNPLVVSPPEDHGKDVFADEYHRVAAEFLQERIREGNSLLYSGGRSRDVFLRAKEVLFRIRNIFDSIQREEMRTKIIDTLTKFREILSANFPEYKEAESVVDRLEIVSFLVSAPEAHAIVRLSRDQAERLVTFAGFHAHRRLLQIAETNSNQIGRDSVSLMLNHVFQLCRSALREIESWKAEEVNPMEDLEFNLLKDIFVRFQQVGHSNIEQLVAELRIIVSGNNYMDEPRGLEIEAELYSVIDQLISNWENINS